MAKYVTEQRRELISFLSAHADNQFTARDIAEQLAGKNISLSAVYRNLAELEKSGDIVCVMRENMREKYYRCVRSDECQTSIHLTCTECGRSFHMDAAEANRMIDAVLQNSGFRVSTVKTVLYGICKECSRC